MATKTSIEWTATVHADGTVTPGSTWNPWWGCVKVSEACRNCYAATLANRFGTAWGPQARRRFFGEAHWQEPEAWNRRAEREGRRLRVFCASMGDVFEYLPREHPDREAMKDARMRLWLLIERTPHLDWLLLTKRPEMACGLTPAWWTNGHWPANAWLGTTAETQGYAEQRIPELLRAPAPVRFLSVEPMLAPVDLHEWLWRLLPVGDIPGWAMNDGCAEAVERRNGLHWVIIGTESGPGRRPLELVWCHDLLQQCKGADVPAFVKQLPVGGRVSHDLEEWPAEFRVREWPAPRTDPEALRRVG